MKIDNKINNIDLFKSYIGKNHIKLKEGSVLKAKLIKVFEGNVLLELGKGNYITGATELNLHDFVGSMISFLVKGMNNNVVEIKPLLSSMNFNNSSETIIYDELQLAKDIIKLYSIDDRETNTKAIEAMIKFKMPLNKENVFDVIKYINKLDFLIKATDDELYHLLNVGKDLLNIDISKITFNRENQTGITINDNKTYNRDIQVDTSNDFSEVFNKNSDNIMRDFIHRIKQTAPFNKLSSEIIKQVVFLKKYDVEISFNNIKHFSDLLDNNSIIENKINLIIDKLLEGSCIDKTVAVNLKNQANDIKITFTKSDKDNINNYFNKIISILNSINEQATDKNISNDLQENIKELNNIIKLVNKLNENLTFLYIPFTLKDNNIKSTLCLLSKNKKSQLKRSNQISAFIKFETKNLSTIEIMCLLIDDSLNINFKVEEQIVNYFEENKSVLIGSLNTNGFSKVTVNINKQMKKDVLDLLADEEYMNYKLNIKV